MYKRKECVRKPNATQIQNSIEYLKALPRHDETSPLPISGLSLLVTCLHNLISEIQWTGH